MIRPARVANWLAIGLLCFLTFAYVSEVQIYGGMADRMRQACGRFSELDRLSSTPILAEIMSICAEALPDKADRRSQ